MIVLPAAAVLASVTGPLLSARTAAGTRRATIRTRFSRDFRDSSNRRSYALAVLDLPVFDCDAFYGTLDQRRRELGLGWYELADELWDQSAELNAGRDDHPICGGAVSRQQSRGATSCQYALFMLRWLGRAPEDFLTGPVVDVGDTGLPEADIGHRLRWDLAELYEAVDHRRRELGLTWARLATEIDCTPSRLTNLRTARLADMNLAMRLAQWVGRPAAAFVHPARW